MMGWKRSSASSNWGFPPVLRKNKEVRMGGSSNIRCARMYKSRYNKKTSQGGAKKTTTCGDHAAGFIPPTLWMRSRRAASEDAGWKARLQMEMRCGCIPRETKLNALGGDAAVVKHPPAEGGKKNGTQSPTSSGGNTRVSADRKK